MPEYKIDKNVFSAADLSAILMGLSGLSNMVRGDEIVNALAKVKLIWLNGSHSFVSMVRYVRKRKQPVIFQSGFDRLQVRPDIWIV